MKLTALFVRSAYERHRTLTKTLLVMKLTLVLLTAAALQVSAKGTAQTVTFSGKDVPLEQVFSVIKQQTGYVVAYDYGMLNGAKPVSLSAKDLPLQDFLNQALHGQSLDFIIKKKTIFIKKLAVVDKNNNTTAVVESSDQQPPIIDVKGRVMNEKGEPLVGASIKIKGTNSGTTSGSNGEFTITVRKGKTALVISFIGYETKTITVDEGEPNALITLTQSADNQLNDVVVIGYSSKELSNISGSVSVVSGKELNDVTSTNISSLLQGKVAGVIVSNTSGDPSAIPTPIIRGSGSISAASAPLYVVDGIIGGMANPNDVESITVLKDAAVTGLYGSRAANGVIIITTKSGQGKPRVSFSSNAGFNKVTTGRFKIMDSRQLYDYHKSFMLPAEFETSRPNTLLQQNTNWMDLAFRTGTTQEYSLLASGGSEKTQFYTSANYYNEEGTLRNNGLEKYSLRANISHKLSNKLKLSLNIYGDFNKFQTDPSNALYGAYTNLPWDNPYNTDGTLKVGNEQGWLGREQTNFLHAWQYNFNRTKQANVVGDLNLVYKITPALTFSTFNRASYQDSKNVLYNDVRSKTGRSAGGSLFSAFATASSIITSNRLEYKRYFGQHSLNLLGVAEAEKNFDDRNDMTGQGLPAGLYVMDVASKVLTGRGNTGENAFSKGLVQADYNYANRYFAVASFINESASRFGANNRSANFYTLSGSWILSNEHFMATQNTFDLLKIRASYGSTGNAQISNYQSLGLYTFSYQYSGFSGSLPSQLANNDLTWEKAKTTNLGLDIGLFKRISVSVDLYDKTTAALLLNVPLAYTTGYSSVFQNVGSVRNRGLELVLNTVNLKGKLQWRTNFNIAFNRNRVLKLVDGKNIVTNLQNVSIGRDLNSWYMRKWVGVDPSNGDPLWEKMDTDGHVTTTNSYSDATLQFVGKSSPDFTGGITNSFSYEGFSLSLFFNFLSGNQIYNYSREFFDSDGSYQTYNNMVMVDGWKRWEKAGDIATHPKSVTGGNMLSNKPSSRYLEDGSYIRLRNITFSYDLPESFLKRIKIPGIRVYISGDNLWTGTNFTGTDPEVLLSSGSGGVATNGGVSFLKYPISKKVLFGINVNL